MFEILEGSVGMVQDDTLWIWDVGAEMVLEFEGVGAMVWELEGVDA